MCSNVNWEALNSHLLNGLTISIKMRLIHVNPNISELSDPGCHGPRRPRRPSASFAMRRWRAWWPWTTLVKVWNGPKFRPFTENAYLNLSSSCLIKYLIYYQSCDWAMWHCFILFKCFSCLAYIAMLYTPHTMPSWLELVFFAEFGPGSGEGVG